MTNLLPNPEIHNNYLHLESSQSSEIRNCCTFQQRISEIDWNMLAICINESAVICKPLPVSSSWTVNI